MRGERGAQFPRAPKGPDSVTSTFLNTVHLFLKDHRFEHGGANLASCPGRHLTSLRPQRYRLRESIGEMIRGYQCQSWWTYIFGPVPIVTNYPRLQLQLQLTPLKHRWSSPISMGLNIAFIHIRSVAETPVHLHLTFFFLRDQRKLRKYFSNFSDRNLARSLHSVKRQSNLKSTCEIFGRLHTWICIPLSSPQLEKYYFQTQKSA